jgi:hypothetical protein
MDRSLTFGIFGALAGFGVSFLAWTGLAFFGFEPPRAGFYIFTVLGAVLGGWIGSHGGSVARWSGGLALLVGAIGLVAGVVGPLLLQGKSSQGPLLFGMFVTGPCGAIFGATVGMVIGALRERRESRAPSEKLNAKRGSPQ